MLGAGDAWPPVTQWLDPELDERLIATALAIVEERRQDHE